MHTCKEVCRCVYKCPFSFSIDEAAHFYQSNVDSSKPELKRFESKKYPGYYLVIENNEPVKAVSNPTTDTDVFEEISFGGGSGLLAFKIPSTDCFIAMDENGDAYGPCNLSTSDYETGISREVV